MTDENTEAEDATESLTDVQEALESEGATPDETEEETEQEDDNGLPGPLGAIESLQGTGKDIEAYSDSPIASAVGPEDSQGAKHIARGVDGLSPLGAMNPIIDIGIGVVLIQLEKKEQADESEAEGTEIEQANPADDPSASRVSEDLA